MKKDQSTSLNTCSIKLRALARLWFLAMKPKMSPTIGAMLSDAVLEELQKKIKEPHFWKELDILSQRYYSDANKCRDTIEPNYMFSNAELMALKNKLFKL